MYLLSHKNNDDITLQLQRIHVLRNTPVKCSFAKAKIVKKKKKMNFPEL